MNCEHCRKLIDESDHAAMAGVVYWGTVANDWTEGNVCGRCLYGDAAAVVAAEGKFIPAKE